MSAAMFDAMDTNKDGVISRSEFAAGVGVPGEPVAMPSVTYVTAEPGTYTMPAGSMTYAAPMTYSTPMVVGETYAGVGAAERYNVSPDVFEKLLRGEAVSEEEITKGAPALTVDASGITTSTLAPEAATSTATEKKKSKKKVAKVSKKKSKGCC
jgi:hypothetical protein